MKGILTKAVGGFFFPADEEQNIYSTKIRGRIQKTVYPGDYVEFSDEMIENVLPRENLLSRPKIANVDCVMVVFSTIHPELDRNLLDRFLVLIESNNLIPIIIINKIDLLNDDELLELNHTLNDYNEAGYKTFLISAKTGQGVQDLKNHLKGITVMAGPSGVGKSSIINKLVTGADLEVGKISSKLKRGRHTTRHVKLLPIKNSGWIADTPGFSSLDISNISLKRLVFAFPELNDFVDKCRFTGCSHTHEPGCAVKESVNSGRLSKKRYQSYKSLYEEINSKDIKY